MKTKVKGIIYIIVALISIVCIGIAIDNSHLINCSPFEKSYVWDAPNYVAEFDNSTIVVDSSKTRISVLNENMEIDAVIFGGDDFSNADYVAANSKGIYVADLVYASNSNRVGYEAVKKFNFDGSFEENIFSVEYENGKETMPAQIGYICWMGEYDDEVYFIFNDKTEIAINKITDNGYEEIRRIEAKAAPDIWNIAYSVPEDKIWIVGKDSRIYSESQNGFELYDNGALYTEDTIYSDIDVHGDKVYATDLGLFRVISVTDGSEIISGEEGMLIYRVFGNETGIAVTDNVGVIFADKENGITYYEGEALYSQGYYTEIIILWIAVVFIILIVFFILINLLINAFKNSKSKYTKLSILVAITIIISTTLISYTIIGDTFGRISTNTYDNLKKTAEIVSKSSSSSGLGDAVNEVNGVSDYGNEAYKFIRNTLDIYCDAAYNNGGNMYYIVFKFNDDLIYGITDYENTIGTVYPYCPYEDSGYDDVVETREISFTAAENDAYGAWSYACAPIVDSENNVVALVEFGINMMSENTANAELINSIIVRVAVIILLIILALIEGTALLEGISGFKKEKNVNIPYFLRPMIFLTFFASNLSAAFIPHLSMQIYSESPMSFIGDTLASALPMSMQLFATAVAALICGRLLEKFNMKSLMITAGIIQIIGYGVISASVLISNYIVFSLGHFISGCGIGFVIVSLNALPDQVDDEERRNNFYASLNAGIIAGVVFGSSVGTYIADIIGYSGTFIVSALLVAIVMYFTIISVGKGKHASPDETEESKISVVKFLTNSDVLSFIVCVMIPFLIMLYFKDYLFPMYGYDNGMDDISIGNVLLFAGATSIIFGTTISDWLTKRFGETGILAVSAIATSISLILFGLEPSKEMAVFVVFLLSLVAGFGLAGQEIFYSSLPAFKSLGAKRSMSIYSIFDNISQTAGPLVMGAMLFMGYDKECLTLGAVGLGLFAIFAVIRLISKLRKRNEKND